MLTANALAAPAAGLPLARATVQRRKLGPHDVLIDVSFCGICHSDIHAVHGDFGKKVFPLTPGHEITGIVAATGGDVSKHRVGDRVGVGCMVNSCGHCTACLAGEEQYCAASTVMTYGARDRDGTITQGGYATQVVVTEDFVLRIPEALALDVAAPLLCAGITTYSPLLRWGAGPGKHVAVVGLGGLGHMGVKIAHALGAEVTVLSQSLKKMDDGFRLGADHYYATRDRETFTLLANTQDLVLNTVSAPIDVGDYLSALGLGGVLVNVGLPSEPMPVKLGWLLRNRRIFAGSIIGGIRQTQEMLDFCGEHGVGADIETVSADAVNESYERVLASDVRYRFVIDVSTLS